MVMENRNIPETTPLPGVIKVISAGCNLIAGKVYLLTGPILLDLFLLFGPRLRIDKFAQPLLDSMLRQLQTTGGAGSARQLDLLADMFYQAVSTVNLFGFLRTQPIGLSVIFTSGGDITPLGAAPVTQVTSALLILLLIILFSIIGVVLGTVYYGFTAAAAGETRYSWKRFGKQLLNVILFYAALIVLLVILSVPFLCLMTILFMTVPLLYQIAMLIAVMLGCWLLIPLFYIPHGIFMKDLDFPAAVKESFKLASWGGMITIRFLMLALLISLGLDMVWTIPEQSSWLILISIFGHAFVSASMLAASFILFIEMDKWQNENRSFLEWRRANLRIKQFLKKEPEKYE